VWLATAFARVIFFDSANPAVCTGCPANILLIDPDQRLGTVVGVVSTVLAVLLALAVGWRVWRHWVYGTEAVRRALLPAIITAPITIIDVLVYLSATWIATTAAYAFINGPAYQLIRLAVPLVLLAGVLRTQLDRSAVTGLLVDIGGASGIAPMQSALRRTLHDGSIRLLAWSVGAGTWVDQDGVAQTLPAPTERVAVTRIERLGEPLAAVVHDPALTEEPALLAAAAAAIQLALDNERLTATVSAQAELAASLPSGRVTLLYADIEGSTGLLARLGDAYLDLLVEERGLIRRAVRTWHGREIDARADEFFAVFPSATDAAEAALTITRRIRTQSWPRGVEVRIRIGLHTGEPSRSTDGYVGLDVHRAARIGNAGHGGQIVVSAATEGAIRGALPADARLIPLGRVHLRGLPEPDDLFQLGAADLPSEFPALRTGVEAPPT
jgi:class 3 adenylate cyclase